MPVPCFAVLTCWGCAPRICRRYEAAEDILQIRDLYDPRDQWATYIINALKAKELFKLDVNYIVRNGEIIIVDEFTGRTMPGRRWSDGLHQAIEAKEGVTIQQESVTLASISYQNLFRGFPKLGGMTGTAVTESAEFSNIYNLAVTVVPTNRSVQREVSPELPRDPANGFPGALFLLTRSEVEPIEDLSPPTAAGQLGRGLQGRGGQVEGRRDRDQEDAQDRPPRPRWNHLGREERAPGRSQGTMSNSGGMSMRAHAQRISPFLWVVVVLTWKRTVARVLSAAGRAPEGGGYPLPAAERQARERGARVGDRGPVGA